MGGSNREEPLNRRIAKLLYGLSGHAMRIKTPQRTFEWKGPDRDGFTFAGWHRLPSVTGVRLLELSESMDPEHWDHWALDGTGHPGHLCLRCKGWVIKDSSTEQEREAGDVCDG